jgi:osomolarity two-component system, sensor histidine kinase CHK1
MLRTLHDQGDLQFDFDRRKWHFKISNADSLPANVVDLIVRGLQTLPPETQDVVKLAACIGSNKFTLSLLSIIYQHSLEETASDLWPALKAGFIVPTSNAYQIPLATEPNSELSLQWMDTSNTFEPSTLAIPNTEDRESDGTSTSLPKHAGVVVTYRFLHDRVQQSAMELIPAAERPAVHGLIGRTLLRRMKLEGLVDSYMFETCNQLNKAREILTEEECEALIRLNLQAGRKALKASAVDGATAYFEIARDLLGEDVWVKRRLLALDVYLANVEKCYVNGRFEECITPPLFPGCSAYPSLLASSRFLFCVYAAYGP